MIQTTYQKSSLDVTLDSIDLDRSIKYTLNITRVTYIIRSNILFHLYTHVYTYVHDIRRITQTSLDTRTK